MTGIAVGLVLASAFLHSGWNYMAKKSADQATFLWLALGAGLVIFAPAFVFFLIREPVPARGWIFIAASAVVHVAYFVFLSRAYRQADLSVVYPLARGTGPMFVLIFALVFLREIPSGLGLAGILLVIAGVYLIHSRELSPQALLRPLKEALAPGSRMALFTGVTIGVYSIVDKSGVAVVNPLVYMWLWVVGTSILLAPARLARREAVWRLALSERWWIAAAGALLFGAYVLVLTALTTSHVSYVAAARESSILIGALYGRTLLRESSGAGRLVGAVAIAAGVALIGLAG